MLLQRKEMVDAVAGHFGRIDALVHLAGGFAGGAVHETDDATWDQMMNMNLRSAFHIFRSVIPHMRKAGGGRIVAIGSRAAVDLVPGIAAYAASKAALVSLIRSISLENKDLGITANAILPSTIGVSVKPETIASLAVYLVSDAAAQITGVAIPMLKLLVFSRRRAALRAVRDWRRSSPRWTSKVPARRCWS